MSYIFPFEDFKEVWEQEPLVILDTNGLLNLYRLSPGPMLEILNILDTISNQIWIPAQVLEEFNRNHKNVVSSNHNKYREVNNEVKRITDSAKNDLDKQFLQFGKFRFPYVKELHNFIELQIDNIRKKSQEYESQIAEEIDKNKVMLKEDKVQSFVNSLIESGRIGNSFTISELLSIFAEGEKRYEYKIPPGYKDIVKDKSDSTKREKFGDLILWKQVLNRARICQKPIIFITMDEKEDWWVLDEKQKHAPLRPREELFIEFKEYSNKTLAMMSLIQFVNHLTKINNIILENKTYLEFNADDVSKELIESLDWSVVLGDSELLSYLIHSGDLQDHLEHPLADVEIDEYSEPDITIDSVDIEDDQVIFEGRFESEIGAIVTEAYSKNYSTDLRFPITIGGSISLEFTVDFSLEEDFIKVETLTADVGGFEIVSVRPTHNTSFDEERCVDCGNPYTSYFKENGDPVCEGCSSKYQVCPDCGYLFETGTIGAFCDECESDK